MSGPDHARHQAGPPGWAPVAQKLDFRAIAESVPGSFLVLSPDLLILAASDAYLRDCRVTRDAIIGRPIMEVFPDRPDPAGLGTLRASLDRAAARRVPDTIAVRRYDLGSLGTEPDTRFWSLVNIPVLGTAGRLDCLIHWLDDVTDLVWQADGPDASVPPATGAGARAVAALLAQARELQRANQALELANQALRDAYDAKQEFVERLSHELRNPLNTAVGFGELLRLDNLSDPHREWITMTLRASRDVVQLLDEAGDTARLEAHTLSLSLGAVRLDTLIADVVDIIRPLALTNGVRLDPGPPPDGTAWVRADGQRLRQILLTLLSNAVKYNHPSGTVTVTAARQPGDRFRISVTDSGRGIASQDLERVFRPFERLSAAEAGVAGTGLGLALSRELTEAMGGATGVSSVPGEGSTFWVELPATEPMAVTQLAIERDAIVRSRSYGAPRTVLYVEDMVENLRLVEHILGQRPSVTVLPAMLGGVALDLARQHRPDLILLDLNLPDMAGEEVLAELRASPSTAGIPVVILTADATRRRAGQAGAEDIHAYLTKPIDVRGLLDVVDGILDDAHALADAGAEAEAEAEAEAGAGAEAEAEAGAPWPGTGPSSPAGQ